MKSRFKLWALSVLYLGCIFLSEINGHALAREQLHVEATRTSSLRRPTPEAYNSLREIFFRYEESQSFGSDMELTQKEWNANQIIMDAKIREYEQGLITPHLFTPSQHVFSVLDAIQNSPLFKYIEQMPKGGVLHAHDTALCSTDFIVQLTYRENLWLEYCPDDRKMLSLKFSKSQPTTNTREKCSWELLSTFRQRKGTKKVDEDLAKRLTMYPTEKFLDNNAAWQRFMDIFNLLDGLLLYAPVWADYYYNALTEFYSDGVQYLEFRSTLPKLYDLEGNNYTEVDTVRIYKETLDKFMAANPGFIGSKLIYAPVRLMDQEGLKRTLEVCVEIKERYPDFVAGFDLVGQEEMGGPLKDFVPQLLNLPDNIDFFFHAGETNWFGSSVDENLIDAVLLGTKRIGHGFALLKHPVALQLIKERDIAVEINPISNQVLQLVSDFRNHPCSHFFANNYPVVISSDDPSFWKSTPLSHDFYVAFLGIASAHSDLRLLKKLAMNSINYSSQSPEQKVVALQKWQLQWDAFIENLVNEESNAAHKRLISNKIA